MGANTNQMATWTPQQGAAVGFMAGPSAAMIAAAESAKAQIQCAYMMAMQCPRSYFSTETAVIAACQNPLFAEKVEYRLEFGRTPITGPTIRLAELIRREWRNIFTTERVMHDDDHQMIIQVTAIDLETNSIETAEVIVPKTVERSYVRKGQEVLSERENSRGEKTYLVKATESEVDAKRKSLISKALRNAIFRLVPSELVQKAITTARATLAKADAADPKDATRRLIACYEEQGVTIEQIEDYIGHGLEKATPADVKKLRDVYRQLLDGSSTWDEVTGATVKDEAVDELNKLADSESEETA